MLFESPPLNIFPGLNDLQESVTLWQAIRF
ncbi:protein of unknown function [Candidatus Methylomirabilis oxygeniifera]|uniref:Uncharacterized protein n=1 Tax=Methylomirabilis oxygeniifera TaxID=671143 RepID=D5MIN4_METO1|nr:protein of unknown function [Candidatus Methylomirabilis oxyfera]